MMAIVIPQTSNANIANSDPIELLRANKLTVDLASTSFPCTKMYINTCDHVWLSTQ